jgi:hypothetical protein
LARELDDLLRDAGRRRGLAAAGREYARTQSFERAAASLYTIIADDNPVASRAA